MFSKKNISIFVLISLCILALFGLKSISFDNDIKVMLPNDPEIVQSFEFFKTSNLSRYVFISFEIEQERDFKSLLRTVDSFVDHLDHPSIIQVEKNDNLDLSFQAVYDYLKLAPQIMNQKDVEVMEKKITPEAIASQLQKNFLYLLTFSASPLVRLMEQDPLNLKENPLGKIKAFSPINTPVFEIRDGYLVHQDHKHLLLMLRTDASMSDGEKSKKLFQYLQDRIATLPTTIKADLIAVQRHAVSNEEIIKKDIFVTVSVASLGFLILFLFVFKDFRGILIFLIPIISVLFAIPICAKIAGELSSIILGMGAVISGIAVDYCIHVYVALRTSQESHKKTIEKVRFPILFGALTTVGVFSVFLFSNVEGYRQLSLFTIVSLLLSLALAILFLPLLMSEKQQGFIRFKSNLFHDGHADRLILVLWLCVVGLFLVALPSIHFKTDVKQYDGTESKILLSEQKFRDLWQMDEDRAVLVVEAKDRELLFERNYEILLDLEKLGLEQDIESLSSVLPPEWIRIENISRWNRFWKEGREEELRKNLSVLGEKYGFKKNAFDLFYDQLYRGSEDITEFENLSILNQLERKFISKQNDRFQMISFFPDEKKKVEAIRTYADSKKDVFVVSRSHFTERLSTSILGEAKFLGFLILIMIPTLTFLFLRNLKLTLIALIPVASSLLAILGGLTIVHLPLNAASLIALLVVGGLAIDYGIFMVYQTYHDLNVGTRMAVTLSALTTLMGAGALVFAKHPVLFAYGTTLVVGIFSGYLSALFVVPALVRLTHKKKVR